MTSAVTVEVAAGVAVLTLNRPERLNAYTAEMGRLLSAAYSECDRAVGIGLTIALQADLRVVAADAKYVVVQVRRGVIPDCMAHWTLARLAGLGVAAELLLTGRTFGGAEAVALGVANRALPEP